jgi:hypothetical protein
MGKADRKPIAEAWLRDALVARIDTHGSVEDAKRALRAEFEAGLPFTYRNADGVRVAGDPRFWHELWADFEPFENRAFIGDPVSSTSDPPYPPSDLPSEMRAIKVAVAAPAPAEAVASSDESEEPEQPRIGRPSGELSRNMGDENRLKAAY